MQAFLVIVGFSIAFFIFCLIALHGEGKKHSSGSTQTGHPTVFRPRGGFHPAVAKVYPGTRHGSVTRPVRQDNSAWQQARAMDAEPALKLITNIRLRRPTSSLSERRG